MSQSVTLLQLYPRDMNIYGDWGNTLTLKRRLEWRGIDVELATYNQGDVFPDTVDLIIGGGGQDNGQAAIQDDLLNIGDRLHKLAVQGVPMLMICGLYQLFGHSFVTGDGRTIKGISLLDITTQASNERMIGNMITRSEQFGDIVGYENHSGKTTLGKNASPLAEVIQGAGNNGADSTEGARYKNVIGSYLHGSLLPKNPRIADFLIQTALQNRYGTVELAALDDQLADQARAIALKRPR